MAFIELGGGDWLGMDIDEITRVDHAAELEEALVDNRAAVEAAIGSEYDIEIDNGKVFVVVSPSRWFEVEVGRNGRLVFTGNLDPDGPL